MTRLLVIGASSSAQCGVRDYAAGLNDALAERDVATTTVWADSRADLREWPRAVGNAIRRVEPDVVLWHYSVFAASVRGIPVAPPLVAHRLHRSGARVVLVAHEFVYPFGRRGLRGGVFALAHRLVLPFVVAAADGVLVTTDDRRRWLESRAWLPRRATVSAPVFSALPYAPWRGGTEAFVLGLIGYAQEATDVEAVVAAIAWLRASGVAARLELLGAPGPASREAERWRTAARAQGCEAALSFSGVLSAAELAGRLASVDAALFANEAGPTARRTSIAAALAAGVPLVALDGPQRWQAPVDADAFVLVAKRDELGPTLRRLTGDRTALVAVGARGAAFAAAEMTPAHAAARVLELADVAVRVPLPELSHA